SGGRLAYPAAYGRNDLVNDAKQMPLILEMDGGLLEPAEPLHKALFVGIDQNIGNRRVLEQRLDRTEADHLVDEVFDKRLQFALIERDPFGSNVVPDIDAELSD